MLVDVIQNILRDQQVLIAVFHEYFTEYLAKDHVDIRVQDDGFAQLVFAQLRFDIFKEIVDIVPLAVIKGNQRAFVVQLSLDFFKVRQRKHIEQVIVLYHVFREIVHADHQVVGNELVFQIKGVRAAVIDKQQIPRLDGKFLAVDNVFARPFDNIDDLDKIVVVNFFITAIVYLFDCNHCVALKFFFRFVMKHTVPPFLAVISAL